MSEKKIIIKKHIEMLNIFLSGKNNTTVEIEKKKSVITNIVGSKNTTNWYQFLKELDGKKLNEEKFNQFLNFIKFPKLLKEPIFIEHKNNKEKPFLVAYYRHGNTFYDTSFNAIEREDIVRSMKAIEALYTKEEREGMKK